jgi:hypothetical protein
MSDYFGAMGTALYNRLAGGTALTTALGGTAIYMDQAPDGAAPPFVVFSHQAGAAENINSGDMRDDYWFVRAYAASRKSANLLDGHVNDLLHRNNLSVSGWTNFWCVRSEQFALSENLPNGEKRYMAGAFYRVRLDA